MKDFEAFIGRILGALARQSGRSFTEDDLEFYLDELTHHDPKNVADALRMIRRGSRQFPTIADIEAAMGIVQARPHEALKAEATALANRIVEAVRKFGYMRGDEAHAYLGNGGWTVVRLMGGWDMICDWTEADLISKVAQMRDVSMSVVPKDRAGELDRLPAPRTNNLGKLGAAGNLPILEAEAKKVRQLIAASEGEKESAADRAKRHAEAKRRTDEYLTSPEAKKLLEAKSEDLSNERPD